MPAFWLVLLLALLATPRPAAAQGVVLEQSVRTRSAEILGEILARGTYLLVDRDTVLGPEFDLPGDMVVFDARVRLEGAVAGSVAVIDGTLFIRPGARVGGPIAAVGGLVLPSGLAEIGEIVELPVDFRVEARSVAGGVRVSIREPAPAPAVALGGLFGVRHLAYDRVDGASLSWGPQWRLQRREFGPVVDGWITLRTARLGQPGGGARLTVPLGGTELAAGVARATLTNEGWIRDDLTNSAGALFFGRDVRDYWESDAAWVTLGRAPGAAMGRTGLTATPSLTLRASRDRTLPSRAPWSLAGRGTLDRPNLVVTAPELLSVEAATQVGWQGASTAFGGEARLEWGQEGATDRRFTHWRVGGRWEMEALWNHSLSVTGHAIGTLDGEVTPSQRWSFVGGVGTLPTLPIAALRGDRVVFLRSEYRVPLTWVQLPLAGSPTLEVIHATGTAWFSGGVLTDGTRVDGGMPAWEQNLAAGLRVAFIRAHAWIDPTLSRPRVTVLVDLGAP